MDHHYLHHFLYDISYKNNKFYWEEISRKKELVIHIMLYNVRISKIYFVVSTKQYVYIK